MNRDLLVAGGGIAGLAAAIGAREAGWDAMQGYSSARPMPLEAALGWLLPRVG